MNAERLTEIRERWAAATPGPWRQARLPDHDEPEMRTMRPQVRSEGDAVGNSWPVVANTVAARQVSDAAAIAAAPADIADLLAEVERLREAGQAFLDAVWECEDLPGVDEGRRIYHAGRRLRDAIEGDAE